MTVSHTCPESHICPEHQALVLLRERADDTENGVLHKLGRMAKNRNFEEE